MEKIINLYLTEWYLNKAEYPNCFLLSSIVKTLFSPSVFSNDSNSLSFNASSNSALFLLNLAIAFKTWTASSGLFFEKNVLAEFFKINIYKTAETVAIIFLSQKL